MTIIPVAPLTFTSKSVDQTHAVGACLGKELISGDIICLQGDLGAGKTTFVQGLAQGWGALDPVSSPTFILVNTYHRADQNILFHLDTYRLESIPEAEELDLDAMMMEGTLLIEWPERLGALIPAERLWIQFTHLNQEERQLSFNANGERYQQLLNTLQLFISGGI